jgi:pimeloyl-ACP methyl ester carboxylesterase
MRYVPDFNRIEDAEDEPLVIHRRGEVTAPALIVLIHGLGGSRYGTWTAKYENPTQTSLPRFLYDDVASLDVGLYRYRTLLGRFKFWKSIELEDEARVLADRLRDQASVYRTLILAGHSMGGILARAAVCELIVRNDIKTLAAIKGMMLLATPQAGSEVVPFFGHLLSADFRALKPHNKLLADAQKIFADRVVAEAAHVVSGKFLIPAYVVAGAEDNWVDRFSSGLSVPSERTNTVRASHFSAVKPRLRTDDGYRWMLEKVRAIVGSGPGTDDPFDACESGGKLFIDRKALRSALRDITSPDGKTRVLAVKGPAQSGKSHSIYYIEHIQRLLKYEKALVELDEDKGPASFMPEDLAESLLHQIGGDATRVPKQSLAMTESRWIGRVADYLVGQIKSKHQMVFVVLDGFGHPSVPQSTRDLVRELVQRADTEPLLRIALLDFTDDLLSPKAAGRSATEPLDGFTEGDLRAFFLAYARKCGAILDPAALDAIVQDVDRRVSKGVAGSNGSVARRVEQWAQALRLST